MLDAFEGRGPVVCNGQWAHLIYIISLLMCYDQTVNSRNLGQVSHIYFCWTQYKIY